MKETSAEKLALRLVERLLTLEEKLQEAQEVKDYFFAKYHALKMKYEPDEEEF